MKFDRTQQITALGAVICLALFVGQTIHKKNLADMGAPTTQKRNPAMADEQEKIDGSIKIRDSNPPIVKPLQSVVSIGQKGGITAGVVNIEQGISEPKLEIKPLVENAPEGELYKTEFILTIISQVPIPDLNLQAKAPTITKMNAVAQRTGLAMQGPSGIREGYAFITLIQAHGSYKIILYSKTPENIEINYEF